ncbi:MAG TPA: hypothetical protein PKM73_14470 [Verrucomicrobiota bacterium]|nr:hypothetical protein [Verrucomicrobiota bacterium]
MATPDLTTARGLIEVTRDKFFPRIIPQIFQEHPLLQKVRKAVPGEEMIGLKLVIPLKLDNASSTVFSTNITSEMDLPLGGRTVNDQLTITPRKAMSTVSVADVLIDRMQEGGSWARPWAYEMDSLKEDMGNKIGYMLHGDSTAKLATVASFSSGTPATVTVDSTRMLNEGMKIDFIRSGSDVSNAVSITITRITSATTFTATISGTPQAADVIVPEDSYGAGPHGLGTVMDNTLTDYFGINRAADYRVQVNVVHNNGGNGNAALNPLQVQYLLDTIYNRSGKKPDELVCRSNVYKVFTHLLRPDMRFDPSRKGPMFGSGVDVDGVPVMQDQDSPANTVRALRYSSLIRGQIKGFIHPHAAPDGTGFIRPALSQSTDKRYSSAWECSFTHYGVLGAMRFNDLGYIDEIAGLFDANAGYANLGGYS